MKQLSTKQMRNKQAKRLRRRQRIKGTRPHREPAQGWGEILAGLGWFPKPDAKDAAAAEA